MTSRASIHRVALRILGSLALLLGAAAAPAQTVLLEDSFDPATLARWQPSPLGLASNWSSTPGTASYNGGGHTQLVAGDAAWADYTVSVRFRLANASDYPGGLRGRVNPVSGRSYAAWIYPAEGKIKLFRAAAWNIDSPGLATLGEATIPGGIAAGVFHGLSLTFAGSQITVRYEGTAVLSVTDTGEQAPAAGKVALDVSSQPIEWDDVAVTTNPVASTSFFADDFSSNSLAAWTASPLGLLSSWSAAAGTAAFPGAGHTQLYAGSAAWTDYRVEAKVRLANGSNHPGGLRGRVDLATGASYAAWLYPADGKIKLYRAAAWDIDTPGLTLLGEFSPVGGLPAGSFQTLGIDFAGARITVLWNGVPVIATTDSSSAARASGAVALDVSNQPIEFDDVAVGTIPVPAAPLFADDFDPATPSGPWSPSPLGLLAGWGTSAGTAAYDGGGHTQLVAGSGAWSDYTVSAKFRLAGGDDYPGGLRGRVDPATGAGYAAWIYPSSGTIKLYRAAAWHIDTSGLELLAQHTVDGGIAVESFHELALDFSGSRVRVLYEGSEVISFDDTASAALAAGAVALDVSNRPIEWDDVQVATPAPAPPAHLFEDDFASGLSGWTPSPLGLFDHWTGSAGTAAYDGSGHTQIYAGDPAWANYRVEGRFRLANGSNFPGGLRGRVNTTTGQSYAAWLYPGSGEVKLFRAAAWNIDTPGLTVLGVATIPGGISAGVFHSLALSFSGDQITVTYDGADVLAVTDGVVTAGAIALDVSNQPVEWDDVVVTPLSGSTTPPETPAAFVDDGPGGPLLVIHAAARPYSRYATEILRAEGLNAFATADIATLTAGTLAAYDLAILGDMPLTTAQVTLLSDWVAGGGRLIALRPDAQLASLLGITPATGTLAEGYLQIATASGPGHGLAASTLQFHGTADRYTLSGATAVAELYSNATTATGAPAVTWRAVGSLGGQAAAFTFDLARSIATTRQGNPAWSGQERDGVAPIRSDDLFFGNAASDPQPDWIDLNKVAIPQADEEQRLLVHLILSMTADLKPLPRFWYFPRGEKAVVLMSGDDHGNNGTQGRFEGFETASASGCSVANWECVRGTSYLFPNTPLAPVDAAAFDAAGFEVGLHLNTGCADWTPASLDAFYTDQLAAFHTAFPALPAPVTNRTHCIAWSDYASQPKIEKKHGIRLDTNYYYWPGSWILDRPGFMTGSGLPMRFADTDGELIDVFQVNTQMTDESGQSFPATIEALLDKALGPEGYYGVMTANMHTDSSTSSGSEAIVAAAQTRGVPVVTARQLLTWLDGKNASSFSGMSWSAGTLTFTVNAATGANGLTALLPMASPAGTLTTLTVGGSPVAFTTETIKGTAYAVFPAASGNYQAMYVP